MTRVIQRLALFLLFPLPPVGILQAQVLTQDNADCVGAIPITDSVHVCPRPLRGVGNKLEIKENPIDDKEWFEREHNTTWYTFRAPVSTTLTFDIIPDHLDDDIDFLLFEGAIPGICDKISTRQVKPVRSNISRNDKSNRSICGLRDDAPDEFVRSGVGSSFSKAIQVEKGQLFYLVIDFQNRPLAGYTIHFHYDPPPPPAEKDERPKQKLVVNVADARTGAPVKAVLTLEGVQYDKVIEARDRSSYEFFMPAYTNVKVGCVHPGYMFHTARLKGSMDPEVKLDIKLTPIAPGEKVVLEDIRFVGNDTKVMRQSEGALVLLLRFMQANPGVKVEISGHVNGPTFKNKKEFIDLSTARARAVHDFLLINDVPTDRMTYVGIGNAQMLFPDPKNKEQSEANRRVEVKVLSN